jgi:peptidyl-prolyl cis-trans isomerase C
MSSGIKATIPAFSPRHAAAAARSVLLLSVAAFLAGCSGGPKPAEGAGASSRPQKSQARVWRPAQPDTLGPVVAIVGNRKITRHEVDSLISTAPSGLQEQLREPESYREAVNRLMTEEVFFQAAQRSGIERDSAYLADIEHWKRTFMMRHYFERAVRQLPAIPDSSVRAYYEKHLEQYTIQPRAKVRHIALPTRAKALEVRRQLVSGAPWDQTTAKVSTDKATRQNGGLIGWVTRDSEIIPGIGKAPAIAKAAFSIPLDRVSQPIQADKSWHLIRVETREEKAAQPFEAVSARIRENLASERRDTYGKTLTDSLFHYYNATIFDDSIKVALVPAKSAEDFFKEAQAAATPLQRIELYRMLIQRFPTDRVSTQAQFMIGFTYAEELNEYDLARKEFEAFLKAHPDSELAGSAKWMLENMDKPAPPLEGEGKGTGTGTQKPTPSSPGESSGGAK